MSDFNQTAYRFNKREVSEFEDEYDIFVPNEKEVRLVANRNRQCNYYLLGIQQCRKQVAYQSGMPTSENHELGFLPCKKIVDAHYRCMTNNVFGNTLEESPEYAQTDANAFTKCLFQEFKPIFFCRPLMDGILRKMVRNEGSKLPEH